MCLFLLQDVFTFYFQNTFKQGILILFVLQTAKNICLYMININEKRICWRRVAGKFGFCLFIVSTPNVEIIKHIYYGIQGQLLRRLMSHEDHNSMLVSKSLTRNFIRNIASLGQKVASVLSTLFLTYFLWTSLIYFIKGIKPELQHKHIWQLGNCPFT